MFLKFVYEGSLLDEEKVRLVSPSKGPEEPSDDLPAEMEEEEEDVEEDVEEEEDAE